MSKPLNNNNTFYKNSNNDINNNNDNNSKNANDIPKPVFKEREGNKMEIKKEEITKPIIKENNNNIIITKTDVNKEIKKENNNKLTDISPPKFIIKNTDKKETVSYNPLPEDPREKKRQEFLEKEKERQRQEELEKKKREEEEAKNLNNQEMPTFYNTKKKEEIDNEKPIDLLKDDVRTNKKINILLLILYYSYIQKDY